MSEATARRRRRRAMPLKTANAAMIAAGTSKGSLGSRSLNARSLNGSAAQALPPIAWDALTFQIWIDGKLKFRAPSRVASRSACPTATRPTTAAVRVSGNVTVQGDHRGRNHGRLGAA
jgi:hypothetical protein